MNKLVHGLILAFFYAACCLVWMTLQLPLLVRVKGAVVDPPVFTTVCVAWGPWIIAGLAVLATVYCICVWIRKADSRSSWVGFLAVATGALLFVMLPVIIAVYLPLIVALQHLVTK